MDEDLLTAVLEGDVGCVQLAFKRLDVTALGTTDTSGRTVLHEAADMRCPTSLPVLELLVEAMTEEQVSARSTDGDVALGLLLKERRNEIEGSDESSAISDTVWLSESEGVSLAMTRKMTRDALLQRPPHSKCPAVLLCLSRHFRAVEAFVEQLPHAHLRKGVPLANSALSWLIVNGKSWEGDEEAEGIVVRLVGKATGTDTNDMLAYRLSKQGYPVAVIVRVLQQIERFGRSQQLNKFAINVLHGIAESGREELLDAVMPFVTVAHKSQQSSLSRRTPHSDAKYMFERTGDERFLRTAARLQTHVKSAVE